MFFGRSRVLVFLSYFGCVFFVFCFFFSVFFFFFFCLDFYELWLEITRCRQQKQQSVCIRLQLQVCHAVQPVSCVCQIIFKCVTTAKAIVQRRRRQVANSPERPRMCHQTSNCCSDKEKGKKYVEKKRTAQCCCFSLRNSNWKRKPKYQMKFKNVFSFDDFPLVPFSYIFVLKGERKKSDYSWRAT